MVRLPAVAGSFYPSNAAELSALISEYVTPKDGPASRNVKACLVPHAGFMYSGHVAGTVFSSIRIPKKIVVLGVRHRPPGSPAAIMSNGVWRTPLGDAEIDHELAEKLRVACPLLTEDPIAHSKEHSLEMQIPFLQILSPGFRLAPIAPG